MNKFPAVRVKFINAMLTVHGIYNTRYAIETFGIATARANCDVSELRKTSTGFSFDHSTLSYEADGSHIPMPGAAEFLKSISVAFGAPDYSLPGSVCVTRAVINEEKP